MIQRVREKGGGHSKDIEVLQIFATCVWAASVVVSTAPVFQASSAVEVRKVEIPWRRSPCRPTMTYGLGTILSTLGPPAPAGARVPPRITYEEFSQEIYKRPACNMIRALEAEWLRVLSRVRRCRLRIVNQGRIHQRIFNLTNHSLRASERTRNSHETDSGILVVAVATAVVGTSRPSLGKRRSSSSSVVNERIVREYTYREHTGLGVGTPNIII
ncbi:hypothetical protein EVAR_19042_1 [Eumeta japonica]|uniref:Uncharacterized protein n=1 Tax=Eumeta variegata TaxID=151549 RepID=A0A4C1V749_EUMVA|nr:hypothetical protein EVAR_19042_1 [Eumeta japonica]